MLQHGETMARPWPLPIPLMGFQNTQLVQVQTKHLLNPVPIRRHLIIVLKQVQVTTGGGDEFGVGSLVIDDPFSLHAVFALRRSQKPRARNETCLRLNGFVEIWRHNEDLGAIPPKNISHAFCHVPFCKRSRKKTNLV